MTYAPVCIPTLNRYEHLRQCLESLSRCTWADQTEVYVALDYPPANQWDKYAPGWEKNREFLRSCGDMGFKKLHVIEREENYGTWMPGDKGNGTCLMEDVLKRHDRYIYSEDDMFFSPNFLVYMDKGLEKFEHDPSVFGLTGFRMWTQPYHYKNTWIKRSGFNPWGNATWRRNALPGVMSYTWFREHLSLKNSIAVYQQLGYDGLMLFWKMCNRTWSGIMKDSNIGIYMAINNMQQIMPSVSLVRNMGMDGSGVEFRGMNENLKKISQEHVISKDFDFEFIGDGIDDCKEKNLEYANAQIDYWKEPKWRKIRRFFVTIAKLVIYK